MACMHGGTPVCSCSRKCFKRITTTPKALLPSKELVPSNTQEKVHHRCVWCVCLYYIYIYIYICIIHISLGCVPTQELGCTSKQSQKSQHPLPSHVKEPTPAPCGEPSAWLFELGSPCPTKGCAESSRSFAHRPGAEELILWSLGWLLFG